MIPINKLITAKRRAVRYGIFQAELNKFLQKEFAEDGYSELFVKQMPKYIDITVNVTNPQGVMGERGRRICQLQSVIEKRFGLADNVLDISVGKLERRGLSAVAQCESLRYKLIGGLAVRRACYGVLRFIMEANAQGCEIIISGKLRGQRAKSMKFVDGLMIHSGHSTNDYISQAVCHIPLRQGVLGIKVKILLPHDSRGVLGPKTVLPDHIQIHEPHETPNPIRPHSEHKQYDSPALFIVN